MALAGKRGDLLHALIHTLKDGPLASPRGSNYNPQLFDRSGSDHSSGAAFITITTLVPRF